VLKAIRGNFGIGYAFMAEEFRAANSAETFREFEAALRGVPLAFEPHIEFKKRVPKAIGLIRTADTIQFANMILESA
jgi:D-ribose pyranase